MVKNYVGAWVMAFLAGATYLITDVIGDITSTRCEFYNKPLARLIKNISLLNC